MNNALMSKHIADRIGVSAVVNGQSMVPYIGTDGLCYIHTVGGPVLWDLFGDTPLSRVQRNMRFVPWAQQQGLPSDPQACAIATGYIGP